MPLCTKRVEIGEDEGCPPGFQPLFSISEPAECPCSEWKAAAAILAIALFLALVTGRTS